jgi:hypothetical protein
VAVDTGSCRTLCSRAAAVAKVLLSGARTGVGDDVGSRIGRDRKVHRRIDMIAIAGRVCGTAVGLPARATGARATGSGAAAARATGALAAAARRGPTASYARSIGAAIVWGDAVLSARTERRGHDCKKAKAHDWALPR